MPKEIIPILGVDTQADEYSAVDGSCLQMDKFRPIGKTQNPKWEVITEPNALTFAEDPDWSGSIGTVNFTVLGLHYAFDKWYAAVYLDTGFPDQGGVPEIILYSCTKSGNVLTFDAAGRWFRLISDGSMSVATTTKVYFKDIGEEYFYVLISPGETSTTGQHQIWKVSETLAIPNVFQPELNLVQVSVDDQSISTANFDNLYPSDRRAVGILRGINERRSLNPFRRRDSRFTSDKKFVKDVKSPNEGDVIQANTYPGILKDKDKHFGVITAFKHPNGSWYKHSQPHVFRVDGQTASIGTNTEYATLSFSKNANYTDNSVNYAANVRDLFDLYGHKTIALQWQELGEVGVFLTTGKGNREEAYLEGTYYLIGTLDDNDSLNWAQNEETIVTGEVLNIDPYSHHITTSKMITEHKNGLVLLRSVTNFVLPGWERQGHPSQGLDNNSPINPKINETWAGDSYTVAGPTTITFNSVNEECAVRVTIETEKGTFYRWNTISIPYNGNLPGSDYRTLFDCFLSYPDQRATQLDYYWHDFAGSSDHYLFYTVTLKPHPFLNLAYNLISESAIESRFDFRVVLLTVGSTEALDFEPDNSEVLVEEDEFKISDITNIHLPLEWSYKIEDTVVAAVDNTDEVGDGQFGDYPLYVFGKNRVFGARGSDDVLIAKFDLISNKHGMKGFNAYAIYQNTLFFISSSGIHAMRGRTIEDIYYSVEDVSDNYITTNTTYEPVIEATYDHFSEIISSDNPMIGVFAPKREVIFSSGNSLLIYNTKYQKWYSYSLFGLYDTPAVDEWNDRGVLLQMVQKSNTLSLFMDNNDAEASFVYEWGTDTAQCDKFGIITNPIVLGDYGVMKRWGRSVLQGNFVINAVGSDPGNGNYALNVTLQGKRTTNDNWIQLISYTQDTTGTINSFYLKSNKGSFQAFRIVINGENLAAGSYIAHLLVDYIVRGRRFNI